MTACRELPQCFWRCQMLFASISTGRSEVPLVKLMNSQLFKISVPSKQLTKQNQENDWVDTSFFPLIWKQRCHSLCYLQSKFAQRHLNNAKLAGQNKERNFLIMAKREIPFVYLLVSAHLKGGVCLVDKHQRAKTSSCSSTRKV